MCSAEGCLKQRPNLCRTHLLMSKFIQRRTTPKTSHLVQRLSSLGIPNFISTMIQLVARKTSWYLRKPHRCSYYAVAATEVRYPHCVEPCGALSKANDSGEPPSFLTWMPVEVLGSEKAAEGCCPSLVT